MLSLSRSASALSASVQGKKQPSRTNAAAKSASSAYVSEIAHPAGENKELQQPKTHSDCIAQHS